MDRKRKYGHNFWTFKVNPIINCVAENYSDKALKRAEEIDQEIQNADDDQLQKVFQIQVPKVIEGKAREGGMYGEVCMQNWKEFRSLPLKRLKGPSISLYD